jgi:hypothetical protein
MQSLSVGLEIFLVTARNLSKVTKREYIIVKIRLYNPRNKEKISLYIVRFRKPGDVQIISLYKDREPINLVRKHKRLKLGGVQAYDRSSV